MSRRTDGRTSIIILKKIVFSLYSPPPNVPKTIVEHANLLCYSYMVASWKRRKAHATFENEATLREAGSQREQEWARQVPTSCVPGAKRILPSCHGFLGLCVDLMLSHTKQKCLSWHWASCSGACCVNWHPVLAADRFFKFTFIQTVGRHLH